MYYYYYNYITIIITIIIIIITIIIIIITITIVQSFSAEMIIIIANFLVLTTNIMLNFN